MYLGKISAGHKHCSGLAVGGLERLRKGVLGGEIAEQSERGAVRPKSAGRMEEEVEGYLWVAHSLQTCMVPDPDHQHLERKGFCG